MTTTWKKSSSVGSFPSCSVVQRHAADKDVAAPIYHLLPGGRSLSTSSRPVHCGGSLAVVLSQFFAIQISCAIKLLNDVPFRESEGEGEGAAKEEA